MHTSQLNPVLDTSIEMKGLMFLLILGYVSSDKLDLTYLPPPGSQYAGGRPEDIQVPLEFPKETSSTTLNPQIGDIRGTIPEDYQATIGIDRIPGVQDIVTPGSPSSSTFQNTRLPTTTVSYAFTQTTTHPPTEGYETTIGPQVTGGFDTTDVFNNVSPQDFGQSYDGNININTRPGYQQPVNQFGQRPTLGPNSSPSFNNIPASQPGLNYEGNFNAQGRPGFKEIKNQYGQPILVPTPESVTQYTGSPITTFVPGQQAYQQQIPGQQVFNQLQQGHQQPGNLPGGIPFDQSQFRNQNISGNLGLVNRPGYVPSTATPQGFLSTLQPTSPTTLGNAPGSFNNIPTSIFPGQSTFHPSVTVQPNQTPVGQQQQFIDRQKVNLQFPGSQAPDQFGAVGSTPLTSSSTLSPNIPPGVPNLQFPVPSINQQNYGIQRFPGVPDKNNVFLPSNGVTPTLATMGDARKEFPTGTSFPNLPHDQNYPSSITTGSYPAPTSSNTQANAVSSIYRKQPERPQAEADRNAVILHYENEITPEGYAYSFDTSNGIHADENGTTIDGVKAQGSYSYTGDDGKVYSVIYTADEDGFRPRGDHLPTSPPIPEAIQRVIEQVQKEKEAGISDDGSYDENKYGHKKYQGAVGHRRRPSNKIVSNTDDVIEDDLTETMVQRMKEHTKPKVGQKQPVIFPDENEYGDVISEDEAGEDLIDENNDDRRKNTRPLSEDDDRITDVDDEDNINLKESINQNRPHAKRPINKPVRKQYNKIKLSSSDETIGDRRRPNDRKPSYQESEQEEDFEDYNKTPKFKDNIPNKNRYPNKSTSKPHIARKEGNQYENIDSTDRDDYKEEDSSLRPTSTRRPFSQLGADDVTDDDEEPKQQTFDKYGRPVLKQRVTDNRQRVSATRPSNKSPIHSTEESQTITEDDGFNKPEDDDVTHVEDVRQQTFDKYGRPIPKNQVNKNRQRISVTRPSSKTSIYSKEESESVTENDSFSQLGADDDTDNDEDIKQQNFDKYGRPVPSHQVNKNKQRISATRPSSKSPIYSAEKAQTVTEDDDFSQLGADDDEDVKQQTFDKYGRPVSSHKVNKNRQRISATRPSSKSPIHSTEGSQSITEDDSFSQLGADDDTDNDENVKQQTFDKYGRPIPKQRLNNNKQRIGVTRPPSKSPIYSTEESQTVTEDYDTADDYITRKPSRLHPTGEKISNKFISLDNKRRPIKPGHNKVITTDKNVQYQPEDRDENIYPEINDDEQLQDYDTNTFIKGVRDDETEQDTADIRPTSMPKLSSTEKHNETRRRPQIDIKDDVQDLEHKHLNSRPVTKYGQKIVRPNLQQQSDLIKNDDRPFNGSGYQYIPPQKKFEHDEVNVPKRLKGTTRQPFTGSQTPDAYHEEKTRTSKPFMTPNVSNSHKTEEHHYGIISGKPGTPNEQQENQFDEEQYPQFSEQETTSDQVYGDDEISSTLPAKQYSSTTRRPTQHFTGRPQYSQKVPGYTNEQSTQKGRPTQKTPYKSISSTTPTPSTRLYGPTSGPTRPEQSNNIYYTSDGNYKKIPGQISISSTTPFSSEIPTDGAYHDYNQYQTTSAPTETIRTTELENRTTDRLPAGPTDDTVSIAPNVLKNKYQVGLPSSTYRPDITIANQNQPSSTARPGALVDRYGRPINQPGFNTAVPDFVPGGTQVFSTMRPGVKDVYGRPVSPGSDVSVQNLANQNEPSSTTTPEVLVDTYGRPIVRPGFSTTAQEYYNVPGIQNELASTARPDVPNDVYKTPASGLNNAGYIPGGQPQSTISPGRLVDAVGRPINNAGSDIQGYLPGGSNRPFSTVTPGGLIDAYGRPISSSGSSIITPGVTIDAYGRPVSSPGSTPQEYIAGYPTTPGTFHAPTSTTSPTGQYRGHQKYQPGLVRPNVGLGTSPTFQPSTERIIGEDFSGPKQQQKFDPKHGYYYK